METKIETRPKFSPLLIISVLLIVLLPPSIPFSGFFEKKGWATFGYFGYTAVIVIGGLFSEFKIYRSTKNTFLKFLLIPLLVLALSVLIFYSIQPDTRPLFDIG